MKKKKTILNSFCVKIKSITSSVCTLLKSCYQVVNAEAPAVTYPSLVGESTISCSSMALTFGKFYKIEIYSLSNSKTKKIKSTSKILNWHLNKDDRNLP